MTALLTQEQLCEHLSSFNHQWLSQDLVASKCIKSIDVKDNAVAVEITLGFPCDSVKSDLEASIAKHIEARFDGVNAKVNVDWKVKPHQVSAGVKGIYGVKNIIAVASGKGGVGKSTTAVNLAIALSKEGARVGILDADIYGPSQPIMLGGRGENPATTDKKTIQPIVKHGVQSMSIGYLIDESQATVWRGPMVSGALQQLLNDTQWDDIDYLIVDMPPGTGDIQLTLAQKVPVTGSVIVTTPQDIALADARKGITMFEKVSIPVMGIIENMATHVCSKCGHEEHIFGQGGGLALAQEKGVDLLGSLPLDIRIREQADGGEPTAIAEPDGAIASAYREIAIKMTAQLAKQAVDQVAAFPTLVVSND